jgi:hypothetical protein
MYAECLMLLQGSAVIFSILQRAGSLVKRADYAALKTSHAESVDEDGLAVA